MEKSLLTIAGNQVLVSSRQVSENFEREHKDVLESIRGILDVAEDLVAEKVATKFFYETTYENRGKNYPMYLMNRDGFSLLMMSFNNTPEVLRWKIKYIEAFNQLERIVQEKQTAEWVQARKQGKLTRQAETDIIKQLIDYAKEQGSSNSDKLYIVYSRLANKMAGVQGREIATASQLSHLELMEHVILHCIREGMKLGEHYKQIYKRCKFRLEQLKNIAYLEQTA